MKIFDKYRENSFAIDVLTNEMFVHFIIITRKAIHRFFVRNTQEAKKSFRIFSHLHHNNQASAR